MIPTLFFNTKVCVFLVNQYPGGAWSFFLKASVCRACCQYIVHNNCCNESFGRAGASTDNFWIDTYVCMLSVTVALRESNYLDPPNWNSLRNGNTCRLDKLIFELHISHISSSAVCMLRLQRNVWIPTVYVLLNRPTYYTITFITRYLHFDFYFHRYYISLNVSKISLELSFRRPNNTVSKNAALD